MKFLTRRISAEGGTGDISQKLLCGIFGCHLEFLCKMQKRIYHENKILATILNIGRN